nr:hypothetical protein [Tanacetum cinerariifolium]
MCHIIGIEPQFENIISNGPYIPMEAGQRKPKTQWTPEERKAANLDQRLKSLIMSVLPDDQMNFVINCLIAKSIRDDLILYHEGPSDAKKKFQNSPDDEEDSRSSQEHMNDLEEEYQKRALLAKSKRPESRHTKDFEAKYNKVKAKLAFFSFSASAPCSPSDKNKGLIAESYDWDEKEVSSDNNDATEVKALTALADEERVFVGKESATNDYLCIDLNYVEEQINNLMSKHRNLVEELNTCKEQLLVLKQAKLDLLTMQHVNTKILKENQNLRNELKELTSITEAWLNISSKVNQCISKQIPTQKKKILEIDQLTEDTSSSGLKDPMFLKSLADNSKVSITGSNKPKLSEAKDSTMSNHDTGKHPLPPLEKLTGVEPVFRPKTIKSILKSKSTFKAETLKGITINEPSSAPASGNKSFLVSKTNSAPAGESSSRSRPARPAIPFPSCIHCGYNDHKFDDYVYYPICEICGSYDHDTHGHNRIISLKRGIKPRNPQHVIKNCETCGNNVHTAFDHNDIEWFRKREALQAKKVKYFKASKTKSSSALRSKTPTKKWVSKQN